MENKGTFSFWFDTAIESMLLDMRKNHTIISITHRLSSIIHADHIIVLNQGEIVETGTHEKLLQLEGTYKKLWEKQQGFIYNPVTNETTLIPEWLKMVPLFSPLSAEILQKYANEFVMERKNSGVIVFNEGDRGEKFYILVAGMVEVFTSDHQGHKKVLAQLTDGDFFGEVALIYDTPRNATIKTKSVCIFLTLHYQKFQKLFQLLPEKQQKEIMTIANQRLSEKQRKFLQR